MSNFVASNAIYDEVPLLIILLFALHLTQRKFDIRVTYKLGLTCIIHASVVVTDKVYIACMYWRSIGKLFMPSDVQTVSFQ